MLSQIEKNTRTITDLVEAVNHVSRPANRGFEASPAPILHASNHVFFVVFESLRP